MSSATRKKYSPSSKDTCELPPDVELSAVDKRAISETFDHPFAENNILMKSIDGKDAGHIRTLVFGFIQKIGAKPKFGESIGQLFEFIQKNGTDITMDHRILDAYLKMFPKKFGCFDTSYFGKLFQGCKDTFSHEDDPEYTNVINNKKAKIRYLMKYISIIMRKIMQALVAALNKEYELEIKIPDQQQGGDGDSDIQFNSQIYDDIKLLIQVTKDTFIQIPNANRHIGIASLLGVRELLIYLIICIFMLGIVLPLGFLSDIFYTVFYTPKVLIKIGNYFEKKRNERLPQVYTTTYIKEGVNPMADMPEGIETRGISFVTDMHKKIRNDLRKYYVKTGEDKYRKVTEGEIDDFLMHKEGVTLYEKILDTTDTYAHQITNVERGKGYGAISQKPQLFHYEEIKYPNIPILAELASYKTEEVPDAINELFEVSVANHKGKLEQAIETDISAFIKKKRPLYVMMRNKQYKLPYEIADTTYVKSTEKLVHSTYQVAKSTPSSRRRSPCKNWFHFMGKKKFQTKTKGSSNGTRRPKKNPANQIITPSSFITHRLATAHNSSPSSVNNSLLHNSSPSSVNNSPSSDGS